jgi:ketosteroid isomerase-like protein
MFKTEWKSRTHGSKPTAFSRKVALVCSALMPMPNGPTLADAALDDLVSTLLIRSELQARLFNQGQMDRWLKVANLGDTFTLMQPFGGPVSHGFNATPERLAALAAAFQNGDARLELEQSIASDDIVVLVYVERQDGEVHGLPKQDWSLRVTQVFQRHGDDWKLVHRHADPLVRGLTLETTAALAAGRPLAVTENFGK